MYAKFSKKFNFVYRWISIFYIGISLLVMVWSTQGSTSVELNEELVFISACSIDINTVSVIGITCRSKINTLIQMTKKTIRIFFIVNCRIMLTISFPPILFRWRIFFSDNVDFMVILTKSQLWNPSGCIPINSGDNY